MKRNQFTFYRSFWESIKILPTNKEKLQAFEMICDFALNQTEPDMKSVKPSAAAVFSICHPVLETAHRRAERQLRQNDPHTVL